MNSVDQLKKMRQIQSTQTQSFNKNQNLINQAESEDPFSKIRNFLQNPVYQTLNPGGVVSSGAIPGANMNDVYSIHQWYMKNIFPHLPSELKKGPYDIGNNIDPTIMGQSHAGHHGNR